MKLVILFIILSVAAAGYGTISTRAQSRSSGSGTVNSREATRDSKAKNSEIAKVDFRNYTFPDFTLGKAEKTFTLKNGLSGNKDSFPKYTLRKTYYFDLTGDERDEAISHIIVEGCQIGCEKSNLFYIHTADGKKEKLLWRIATGGDVMGGLKSANFAIDEIVMEVFGDCRVENQVIKPEVDMKKNAGLKTSNFTRFVFTKSENGFIQKEREVLPLPANIDFTEYRPQISFGDPE